MSTIAVTGEAACKLADDLGLPVVAYQTEVSTSKEREIMAAAPATASTICLIVGYCW